MRARPGLVQRQVPAMLGRAFATPRALRDDDASPFPNDEGLRPRSYGVFWKRLLAGAHVRQRPETKFCDRFVRVRELRVKIDSVRCRDLERVKEDLRQVSLALAKQEGYHPWGNGTRAGAENAKRKLEAQLPSLEQHETWLKTQRQTVVRKIVFYQRGHR